MRRTVFTENFSGRVTQRVFPVGHCGLLSCKQQSLLRASLAGWEAGGTLSRDYFFHSSLRDLRILRIKYAGSVFRGGMPFFRAHGRFLVITPVNCTGRPRSRRLLLAEYTGFRCRCWEVLKECLRVPGDILSEC